MEIPQEVKDQTRIYLRMQAEINLEACQDLYNKYSRKKWRGCTDEKKESITGMSLAAQEHFDGIDDMITQLFNHPESLEHIRAAIEPFRSCK